MEPSKSQSFRPEVETPSRRNIFQVYLLPHIFTTQLKFAANQPPLMLVVVMLGPLATVDMIIAAPALAHDYERLVQRSVPMPIDMHAPGRGRLGMAKTTTICQAERTAPLPALPPPPAPRPRRPSTRPSPARDPRVPRPLSALALSEGKSPSLSASRPQ